MVALSIAAAHHGVAAAQLSGSNATGDFGIRSGTQSPPGLYAGYFLYGYDAFSIAGQNGSIDLDGGINISVHALVLSYVSGWKVLGANYGALAILPVQNLTVEAPRVQRFSESDFGFGDVYVQPMSLGWHLPSADLIAWYALFAPTGSYEVGGGGNRGLGMWSHEFAFGTTWYLLSDQSVHLSALGAFELHTEKQDTELEVGNLITVEGGLGGTVRRLATVGVAYSMQWKITDDTGPELPPIVQDRLGRNRNFGIGPELSGTIPLSADFGQALVMGIRYLFEVGSHLDTQGNILVFTATVKAR
jgi:hypothetical protein